MSTGGRPPKTAEERLSSTTKNLREDRLQVALVIPKDAAAILYKYAPAGPRTCGSFIARLLYEHEARTELKDSRW